jgi:hypothetical protein
LLPLGAAQVPIAAAEVARFPNVAQIEEETMKRLAAGVVVLVCCLALTGCPPNTSSPTPKDQSKDKGAVGGEHVLKIKLNHESLSIRQGEQAEVKVTVTREPKTWDEDVTISFKNLPKGVMAPPDGKISKASTEGTFVLGIAGDAPEVDNHAAIVEAKSGDKTSDSPLRITIKKSNK